MPVMTFALVDTRRGDVLLECEAIEDAVEGLRRLHALGEDAGVEILVQDVDGSFTGEAVRADMPRRPRHLMSISGEGEAGELNAAELSLAVGG